MNLAEHVVAGDGAALWCRSVGTDGEPLVVPGAVVDADLEPLAAHRRVVFYDSRNRGRSDAVHDPARLGFGREVADAELVRAHAGLERTAWMGWSYLAGVVVRHALAHPVRVTRIVLVAPVGPASVLGSTTVFDAPPGGLARLDQLRAEGVDRRDPERFCAAWREVHLPLQVGDPATLARMRSHPCRWPNEWPDHVTAAVAHVLVDLGIYDWRSELGGLDLPVLVIHGTDDPGNREAAVGWVTALPDARLIELDGVRRLPWIEAPDRFFGLVGEFLDGGWPADARR